MEFDIVRIRRVPVCEVLQVVPGKHKYWVSPAFIFVIVTSLWLSATPGIHVSIMSHLKQIVHSDNG